MKRAPRSDGGQAELARLLRTSPLLDPALRRHWLRVLPYLSPDDRARLLQILQAGAALGRPPSALAGATDRPGAAS